MASSSGKEPAWRELRKLKDELTAVGLGSKRRSTASAPSAKAVDSAFSGEPTSKPSIRLEILQVPAWQQKPVKAGLGKGRRDIDWLVHGFSTRTGGRTTVYHPGTTETGFDLNLSFTVHDDPVRVATNRKLFLEALCEKEEFTLATLKQIHSTIMRKVESGAGWSSPAVFKGDGLMTATPGVLLGIQTADCIPVLVADRRNRAVAAFHAGWRGTVKRIVEDGIGRMRLEFGSKPEDLIAAIGPGVGQCCYSVGEEVRHEFESQFAYAKDLLREISDSDAVKEKYPLLFLTARAPGHSNLGPNLHLDLAEANRRQLLAAGLRASAIYVASQCTSCDTGRFFSHRKEKGFTGRMMSVIGIRS